MPKFNNLASLDFYIKDIPAHTAATWEKNEIELPSDVDLESEALILYGIEHVVQDASEFFKTAEAKIEPFNFHLIEPDLETELTTCFMSKVVCMSYVATTQGLFYHEGNITPFVPIVIITSFYESADFVGVSNAASEEAFRIWYDDVPLSKDKMANLVNILRGEQV